ncbi:hypothetical protein E3T38_06075 [Cryobacterium sp. Hb1]|nr:hypothetical protein E3T38_06075 [Cryobacterium sp. Hb1]
MCCAGYAEGVAVGVGVTVGVAVGVGVTVGAGVGRRVEYSLWAPERTGSKSSIPVSSPYWKKTGNSEPGWLAMLSRTTEGAPSVPNVTVVLASTGTCCDTFPVLDSYCTSRVCRASVGFTTETTRLASSPSVEISRALRMWISPTSPLTPSLAL